jgi:hypothetical protein
MLPTLLVLLPILLLVFAAAAIMILVRWRPSFGYAWLIATTASLLGWVGVYLWRLRMPQELVLLTWQSTTLLSSPTLRVEAYTWPYALGLVSLMAAVILTASVRFQNQASSGPAWAGSLVLTSLGLCAVLADNPLTLLLAWAALDLLELVLLLTNVSGVYLSQQVVIAFATRVIGTVIVWWAFVASLGSGQGQEFADLAPEAGLFLLLGVGLRLGVYPLHLPFQQEPPLRRGLGTVLRLVPAASSLAILSHLPSIILPPAWMPVFLGFAALAAFSAALLWLVARDEINGRPYWIISLAAFSITCAVRGYPGGSLVWGLQMILAGGSIFLYSAHSWNVVYLPLISFLCLTGLPFSPAAGGWQGLVEGNLPGLAPIYIAAVAMVQLGFLRHALRPGDTLETMERWIHLAYQFGIMILFSASILLGLIGWEGSLTPGVWWASVLAFFLCCGIGFLARKRQFMLQSAVSTVAVSTAAGRGSGQAVRTGGNRWITSFYSVLRLDWLYRFLSGVYRGLARVIVSFTTILEGDGGVLWTLLLLALFVTLLSGEVAP